MEDCATWEETCKALVQNTIRIGALLEQQLQLVKAMRNDLRLLTELIQS